MRIGPFEFLCCGESGGCLLYGDQQGHLILQHFNKSALDLHILDTSVCQDDPDIAGVQAGDDGGVILEDFELSTGARHTDRCSFAFEDLAAGSEDLDIHINSVLLP